MARSLQMLKHVSVSTYLDHLILLLGNLKHARVGHLLSSC